MWCRYFQSRKYEVFPAVFYLHFKVCELQKEESMDADVSSIATIAVRAAQKIFNKLPRLVTQMKHIISASAATKASSNTEGLSTPPGSHTAPAKRKRRSTSDFMQEVQTKLPAGLVEATGKSRRGNKRPGLTELLEAGFIASGKSNLVRGRSCSQFSIGASPRATVQAVPTLDLLRHPTL